ncbi:MAG TPA: hypothetical protein VEU29_03695 [Actinomycetota bacterium]|nr:hypothetical protein [Actinomycetota bacterium]
MPKIAQIEPRDAAAEDRTEKFTKVARRTIDNGLDAARESVERARKTAEDATADQREIALRTTEDLTEANRMVVELLAEQTRHNLEAATAITRAVGWSQILEAQRDYVTASFERMRQLNDRYREMVQAGFKAFALPGRR